MIMTFDELSQSTEKFLKRVLAEQLKYSGIEECITTLEKEFSEELGSGISFLEDAVVDSRCQSIDKLIRDFIKELEEKV